MSHRHYTPSTPPFAFPAIVADAALGRRPDLDLDPGDFARARRGPAALAPARRGPPSNCPGAVVVSGLLLDAIERPPTRLTLLELGADDGRCGKLLARRGVATLIAVDPAPVPDRPRLYADTIVGDLTALRPDQRARLDRHRFDGLVSATGLGVRGVAPSEFVEALDRVGRGGWICVAVDASAFEPGDPSGFGVLIRALAVRGVLEVERTSDFVRRDGDEIREQVALLARKGRAVYDA